MVFHGHVRDRSRSSFIGCAIASLATAALCAAFSVSVMAAEPNAKIYLETIKPLFLKRCVSCHGGLKQEAGLRLDTVELMTKGGESGAAVVAGHVDKSLIVSRVSQSDPALRMPPEHDGESLSEQQIESVKEWIHSGAPAPNNEKAETDVNNHWAFKPLSRPEIPTPIRFEWIKNPIDAFIAREHEASGLVPQPIASQPVLVRRLFLDLIGLPPSVDELAAIHADQTADWYEHLVDRLLADPRHGERWARHWMDVWRYSDWWGLGDQLRNSQKHIWHWRDWIVESLNADTPYDEMIRQMLAADELYPNDLSKLRATGYLARNWFLFNRNQWMDETVEHVGKGFLGLTFNCAKCHDHKYDPIEQADYYRMRAFFEPYQVRMDMLPGEADLEHDGIPCVFDDGMNLPTYLFVRGDEARPDTSRVILPAVPQVLAFKEISITPVTLPLESYEPQRRAWVMDAHLAHAQKKVALTNEALSKAHAALLTAQNAREHERQLQAKQASAVVAVDEACEKMVADAEAALRVAEAMAAVARAERDSVERRGNASKAKTNCSENTNDALLEQFHAAAVDAVRGEREVVVAQLKHKVSEIELRLLRSTADKKESIEKELSTAQEEVDKAVKQIELSGENFTILPGAAWTPTRFKNSTADDPPVLLSSTSSGRRTALAHWIADARNPLTARVAVNQIWMRHVGTPLVSSTFDFGRNGTPPTHPELLDWLASELLEHGWSMKHVHRLIVTSATYRMGSSMAGNESNIAKDPDNRLLWHRTLQRLESQVVRDSILALADSLDSTMGGPPVSPGNQTDSRRRSLYFFHSNNDRNLFLTLFDEAAVKECYRRDQSIVPQQALAMSNSRLVLDSAARIAERLSKAIPAGDDRAFIRSAFITVLAWDPQEAEIAACMRTLEAWRGLSPSEVHAGDREPRAHLVWALLNHNDFVMLR